MLFLSTGLRNKLLDTGSLKSLLAGGFIDVFSGSIPTDADVGLDVSNIKLWRISLNATAAGLTLGVATNGTIVKPDTDVWSGAVLAGGDASFWRFVLAGDDNSYDATRLRIQGAVATAGAEMNLTKITLTAGATKALDAFALTLPGS